MDGMLYAAVAYSTIAKGGILTIDTSAAEAAPGVVLVMTYRNAPKMQPMPLFMSADKAAGGIDLPVMQDRRIHWNGQPIALVLAETQEQADHAKSLITATYHEDASTTSFDEGEGQGHEARRVPGRAAAARDRRRRGGAGRGAASHRRHLHDAAAQPQPDRAACGDGWRGRATATTSNSTIHDATQAVAHMAWSMAQIFGLDEEQVHVTSPYVGGGFGSKTLWWHQVLAAAAASKLAGRPVRLDAVARRRLSPRRRSHDDRAARRAGRAARRTPRPR